MVLPTPALPCFGISATTGWWSELKRPAILQVYIVRATLVTMVMDVGLGAGVDALVNILLKDVDECRQQKGAGNAAG